MLATFTTFSASLHAGYPFDPAGSRARTIPLPDSQLHYVVVGSGPTTLIAVNGGPGFDHHIMSNSRAWSILARTRRIVFYDQRDTGQSTFGRSLDELTVDLLVHDLDRLREQLHLTKVDLAGWSWGGYLSMAYAVQHPDRIAHLVLVDSAPPRLATKVYLFDKIFPEITERLRPNDAPAEDIACDAEHSDDYLAMQFYEPQKRNAFLKAGPYVLSDSMCRAAMMDALKYDLSSAVRALSVRTLVITGRFDAIVAPSESFGLSQSIPAAMFHVFERSGHMPFVEQPEEFAGVLKVFLDEGAVTVPAGR
jgi:proline iminopeptidase